MRLGTQPSKLAFLTLLCQQCKHANNKNMVCTFLLPNSASVPLRKSARALVALTLVTLMAACSNLGQRSGDEDISYSHSMKVRAAAALRDEPDLNSYSLDAIASGRTEQASELYLEHYRAEDTSDNLRPMFLYQLGLIYMNPYNDQRDDVLARSFFLQCLDEHPETGLKIRIQHQLRRLDEQQSPDQDVVAADELLESVDEEALLNRPNQPVDQELSMSSADAIEDGRVQAAEEEYLAVYENSEADEDLRAQSLYQLALINLSPYNQQADRLTALNYLRQLSEEFPESKIRPMADIRIAALLTAL